MKATTKKGLEERFPSYAVLGVLAFSGFGLFLLSVFIRAICG
jgi:hypothetical protein